MALRRVVRDLSNVLGELSVTYVRCPWVMIYQMLWGDVFVKSFGTSCLSQNLDCRIGSKVFGDGSSHCFTSIRKLGNRGSERLRRFNSSKGTNLAILIILAGDIETDPGPRSRCSLCKKYCNVSDKVIECIDSEKRFHAKCSNLGLMTF